MALKLGELVAVLKTDDKQFDKGLSEAHGKFGKFGGKLKVAAAAAGAAAGAALAVGVAQTLDMDAANDKLAAQLGLSATESERIGGIAGDLYADAYGDSLDTVNEAIRGVLNNIEGMTDASDAELQSVTASVLDLSTAFEQDLGETSRAVGKLIKTGLATDATEALDILTRGFQTGADEAGDLLETVSEYSTQFRSLGLDGAAAMGLISQGLAAGARDADVVADSIKEINDRVVKGDAAKGLQALGLNAKDMAAAFAAGGPRAAGALDTILDRLRGVKDPTAQAQIASEIAGEKFVDMQDALFALDPSNATAALGDVKGATDRLGDALNDNAKTALTEMKRGAQAALVDTLNKALPTIEKIVGWLKEHKDIVGPLAIGLGILAGSLWLAVVATAAWNAVLALNPIMLIVIAVAVLVGAILYLATKTQFFQTIWNTVWGGIKAAAQAVGEWFAGPFAGFFVRLWNGIVSGVVGVKNWIVNTWNTVVGFVTGLPGRIGKAARGLWDGLKSSFRSAINWLIDRWNNFSLTLGGGSVLGVGIPSVTLSTPNIPRLDTGGDITRTGLAVVHRGEAVIPAAQAGPLGGVGAVRLSGEFRVRGSDLVLVLRETVATRGGSVQAVIGSNT